MLHKVRRLWTVLASYIIVFDCMLRHTNLIWLGSHYLHSSANFASFESNYAEQNIAANVILVISNLWIYSIYFYKLSVFDYLSPSQYLKCQNLKSSTESGRWISMESLIFCESFPRWKLTLQSLFICSPLFNQGTPALSDFTPKCRWHFKVKILLKVLIKTKSNIF